MFGLTPWRHRRDVDRFRSEMDRLFNRFLDWWSPESHLREGKWMPSMDVSETGKEIMVNAELPGMDATNIDISVRGNVLTLKGERKREYEERDENLHRVERRYGAFSRSIGLPAEVDSEKAEATYKDGVLRLILPKTKEESIRKIQVKTT